MLFLAKAALGATAILALAAVYVFHEGVIRIDVDENYSGGSHVHLWVPATTVSIGLRLTPRRHLERAAAQARPFLPVLREVSKELQRYPNAELLDVCDSSDHVHVVVRAGRLYVDAVNDTDRIHVAFPIEVVSDVADRLEDVAPPI